MKELFEEPIKLLRYSGLIEGVSYLVLLFVAMPLKYLAGMPMAVKITGWMHGMLFMIFVLALALVQKKHKWPLLKSFWAFVASLVPFGTFWLDRELKKELEK